jgi:hypothetical protein
MREVEFYFYVALCLRQFNMRRARALWAEKSPRTGRGQVQQGGWWQ